MLVGRLNAFLRLTLVFGAVLQMAAFVAVVRRRKRGEVVLDPGLSIG